MICLRKIESSEGLILILCDKNLIGKEFQEGEAILSINDFYRGEEIEDIENSLLERAIVINAIGKESINILIKKSILDQEDLEEVKYIQGVPYIFIVKE